MRSNLLFSGLHPKARDLRPVKRSQRRSDSRFTDHQILLLLKHFSGVSVYGLYKRAQDEMPKFYGPGKSDYQKVRNAVNRLESQGKIVSEIVVMENKACRVLTIL